MRRSSARRLVPSVLFLCVIGLAAGCSDDDEGTAAGATTTAAAGDGATDDAEGAGGSGDSGDSGDPADSPVPTSSDVCGLVTAAELQAAFGKPFSDGVGTNQAQCSWASADGAANFNVVVSAANFSATRDALSESGTEIEDIPDVGDGAYWFATQVVTQLGVGRDDRTYIFGYGAATLDPAAVRDQVIAVAKAAVAKA